MIQFYNGFLDLQPKYRNILTNFIPPYTLSVAKTWLNLIVDDLEKHHKFDNS